MSIKLKDKNVTQQALLPLDEDLEIHPSHAINQTETTNGVDGPRRPHERDLDVQNRRLVVGPKITTLKKKNKNI